MKTTAHILALVKAGANVIVEKKSTEHLIQIAEAAAKAKATVTVADAGNKTADHLLLIAKAGKGYVTLDLSE